MNKYILLIGLGLLVSLASAAPTPCYANITATARPGVAASWVDGSTQYQVWDITATNEGTCTLTRVLGFFNAGPGRITEAWNYDTSSGLITGYSDGVLRVGDSFTGAGFVLANSSAPILAQLRPACNESCTAATTAPTSTPTNPTDAGTTAPTNPTDAGTTAPTNPTDAGTTAPTGECVVTATVVRDGSAWTDDQGRATAVYRLNLTNQGPCALQTYVLSFGFYPGELVSSWNLSPARGGYLVEGFGASLAAGATYSGAGLVIAGAPEEGVSANGYGSVCAC